VLAYGTLMFWFCQLYPAPRTRLLLAIGFIALGIGLEFVQGALGYRTYDEYDMLANAIGVLAGWAAAHACGPDVFARIERLLR
jgi:glycopeptide antibiotics resistance protein